MKRIKLHLLNGDPFKLEVGSYCVKCNTSLNDILENDEDFQYLEHRYERSLSSPSDYRRCYNPSIAGSDRLFGEGHAKDTQERDK